MSGAAQSSFSPGVKELIDRLRALAASEQFGPEQVQGVLTEALQSENDWLDQSYQERDEDPVGKLYPLFRADDGRWSMLAAVFAPGVQTPVHNHGAWAVVGTYRGRERDPWFRRLDDGSVNGHAKLEPDTTRTNPAGTVTVVPDGTIHAVEAIDGQEAVSIHIYGTDIVTQPRSTFDIGAGTETPFYP